MQSSRPPWSSRTKLTIILLLLAFSVYLLSRFSAVIAPLIFAVIIAYILLPLTNWFQNRLHIRRVLTILLAYLVFLIILVAIPMVIIPPLTAQSEGLNVGLQRLAFELEKQNLHSAAVAAS